MKRFAFWTVFVVVFSGFDTIFDGLFNGCSFVGNNPASIHLYCNGSTETPKDCSSIIESGILPSSVTELKISACDVEMTESLEDVALKILVGLRKLDVSYNKHNPFVQYLLEESTSENLEHLNASHCELDVLTPSRMPNLVKIDLSFNKIEYIYPDYFYKTKSLNLSSNQISTLAGVGSLISLESLDLSGNAITSIGIHAFDECVNLKTLRIEYLDACAFLRLTFIRIAQAYYKSISKLDTSCVESIEIESDNDKLVIRNTNNENVGQLTKNQLQNLTKAAFGPNQLKNTTKILEILGSSIKDLDISGNYIGKLTPTIFDRFDELSYLYSNRTNLTLSNFNPFENLSKLQYLNMAYNKLQYLNTTIFNKTLNNLIMFDVSYNGLKNIYDVIDCLSSKISSLLVSGNYLREIKPNTFSRFQNMRILCMERTHLQSIDNVLKHCRNLKFLNIVDNNLTNANFTLPPNVISTLHKLRIDGNNLTELPNASYPYLNRLNVTGNSMSCEYVTKLKKQWMHIWVYDYQCIGKKVSYDNNIHLAIQTTTENILVPKISSIPVTYGVPIGIGVIVFVALGVVWFIHRRNQAASLNRVLDHIYAEIGPPTHDPPYNHLNFRNLPPNNEILNHYDNNGRDHREQNDGNDLDIEENIEMEEQIFNPQYNRLKFDAPPNNKISEHYDNAAPNQDDQNDANQAAAVEAEQPNDDAPYDHLQLAVPPPNNKILDHYKNAPPQNEVDDSSDSTDSE